MNIFASRKNMNLGEAGAKYYRLNVCITPPFTRGNLVPKVIVLGGGPFGRWSGRLLRDGLRALRKEAPLPCADAVDRQPPREQALSRRGTRRHLDSGLSRLQNCEKQAAAYEPPSRGISLQQSERTEAPAMPPGLSFFTYKMEIINTRSRRKF